VIHSELLLPRRPQSAVDHPGIAVPDLVRVASSWSTVSCCCPDDRNPQWITAELCSGSPLSCVVTQAGEW